MRPHAKAAIALVEDCCSHTGATTCIKENQLKRDLYRDPLGYYWCHLHKYRGELLLWASEHGWPAIAYYGQLIIFELKRPMYYAIGDDRCKPDDRRALWEMAVLAGNDDMILSAFRYVYSVLEEI